MSAAIAIVVSWVTPSPVHSLDVELDTDTSFQVYEVRALGARAFMARRRLLSRVGLRLSHDLEEPDDDGRVLRITSDVQLRLEQNFGETCLLDRELCVNATDTQDLGGWQPLAADTRLDVPTLWAQIDGLPLGTAARLGRQLVMDDIGFLRFDGGRVSVVPFRGLSVQAIGGLVVRGTTLGGTSRSDPQGSIRLDTEERVPWAAPPTETWMVGASVEGGPGRWLQLRLGFRHMWEADGDVLSRISAAASSQPIGWLRLDASGVFDLLTDEVIRASGRVAIGDETFRVRASVERHVPRFDPGTIWAWFALAPIDQVSLGAQWRVTPDLSLGGALRGRRAELGESQSDDLDAGGDGWFRARLEGFRFGATGFLWSGTLGPLAGVTVDVSRPILGWLELGLDISVWHFDDPNRAQLYGTVLSEVLWGKVRLTPETLVVAEFQHATSRVVGHRFRGIVAFRVDTWR